MSDIQLAIYVNQSVFSVTGEHTSDFTEGRKLMLAQGTDGLVPSTVYTSWYSSSDDLTMVWTMEALLTENLVSVARGPGDTLSCPFHQHTGPNDAGYMAASILTDDDISEHFWSVEALRTELALEIGSVSGGLQQLTNRVNELSDDLITQEILLGG